MNESTLIDLIKIWGAYLFAFSFSLTTAKELLSVLSIALAICYTVYKWKVDLKRAKLLEKPKIKIRKKANDNTR